MLETAPKPNTFSEPVLAILRKISKLPDINDHWERFYTAQIQTVAKMFIEDDCSDSLHVVLTPENYEQLLRYIDGENIALQNLSRYVSRPQLLVLWRKVQPYRDLTVNSRELLKILFKLGVADALLERLDKSEDEANLNEEQKAQLKNQLNASIALLNTQASAIPSDPESQPEAPSSNSRWPFAFGLFTLDVINSNTARDIEIIRNIPMLIRADIPLNVFWRNIFWSAKSLCKALVMVPFLAVSCLITELFIFPAMLYHFHFDDFIQSSQPRWYENLAVGLGLLTCFFLLGVSSIILMVEIIAGGAIVGPSTLMSLAAFIGCPLALAASLGMIVGLGGYRTLIAPVLEHFTQISKVNPEEVKRYLINENDVNFRERFEIEPELTTLLTYAHIPLQYQVMLSNQDIVELKHEVARHRIENSAPELQALLNEKYLQHREIVNRENPDRAILFTYKIFQEIIAREIGQTLRIEEAAFRPRPT